jgi:hypothetical protein
VPAFFILRVRLFYFSRPATTAVSSLIVVSYKPCYIIYVKEPACKAWDDEMAKLQVPAPGAKEGELWALTDVVFLHDMIGLK